MNTFEITLQRRLDDGWPVVVEQAAEEAPCPARRGQPRARPGRAAGAGGRPQGLRHALGQALFRDDVRDAFAPRGRPRDADALRVLLDVEAPDLRALRWERLCAPLDGGWQFLALDQRAALLALPAERHRPALPADRPARPAGARPGRQPRRPRRRPASRPSTRAATVARRPGRARRRSRPTCWRRARAPPARRRSTRCASALTAAPYTLLHVVCHGRVLRDGPRRRDRPLPRRRRRRGRARRRERAHRAARRLGGARGLPHLAFLCACESASAAPRRRVPSAGSPSGSCASSGCRPWWP